MTHHTIAAVFLTIRRMPVYAWCIARDAGIAVVAVALLVLWCGVMLEWASFYVVGSP